MSLFLWLASLSSFTQMVNDPEEMRFCAVGTEIFADAARKRDGPDSEVGAVRRMFHLYVRREKTTTHIGQRAQVFRG